MEIGDLQNLGESPHRSITFIHSEVCISQFHKMSFLDKVTIEGVEGAVDRWGPGFKFQRYNILTGEALGPVQVMSQRKCRNVDARTPEDDLELLRWACGEYWVE